MFQHKIISFKASRNRYEIAVINTQKVGLLEKQLHSLNANRKKANERLT